MLNTRLNICQNTINLKNLNKLNRSVLYTGHVLQKDVFIKSTSEVLFKGESRGKLSEKEFIKLATKIADQPSRRLITPIVEHQYNFSNMVNLYIKLKSIAIDNKGFWGIKSRKAAKNAEKLTKTIRQLVDPRVTDVAERTTRELTGIVQNTLNFSKNGNAGDMAKSIAVVELIRETLNPEIALEMLADVYKNLKQPEDVKLAAIKAIPRLLERCEVCQSSNRDLDKKIINIVVDMKMLQTRPEYLKLGHKRCEMEAKHTCITITSGCPIRFEDVRDAFEAAGLPTNKA